MRKLVAAAVLGCACSLACDVAAGEEELATKTADILEARQEKAESFLVEWSELQLRTPDREGEIVPGQTVAYRMSGRGEKLRQSESGVRSPLSKYDEFIRVFDGMVQRQLYFGGTSRPAGFIDDSERVLEKNNYHLFPVVLSFRPLVKPCGGIELSQWAVIARNDDVDGVSCCVLKHQLSPEFSESVWISNDDTCCIVRRQLTLDRKWPLCQVTIKYVDLDGFGKVPDSWTGFQTYSSSATIALRFSGKVTKLEINPDLPPSEFESPFPTGAVIIDRKQEVYVVRADGSLRHVTEEERRKGVSYDVLMRTEPPAECGN